MNFRNVPQMFYTWSRHNSNQVKPIFELYFQHTTRIQSFRLLCALTDKNANNLLPIAFCIKHKVNYFASIASCMRTPRFGNNFKFFLSPKELFSFFCKCIDVQFKRKKNEFSSYINLYMSDDVWIFQAEDSRSAMILR